MQPLTLLPLQRLTKDLVLSRFPTSVRQELLFPFSVFRKISHVPAELQIKDETLFLFRLSKRQTKLLKNN